MKFKPKNRFMTNKENFSFNVSFLGNAPYDLSVRRLKTALIVVFHALILISFCLYQKNRVMMSEMYVFFYSEIVKRRKIAKH